MLNRYYARIMFDKNGGNRRCVIVKAQNIAAAMDMLDRVERKEDVSFSYREWKMKAGERVPHYVELT